ncbi:MAG: carbonic anhydrase, partial [Saprospiraceae bacterium]
MSADLIKIDRIECIPEEYKNTPIGELLAYHNLGKTYQQYQQAQLLIGMCMDNRKHLSIPDNFAYIIRSGGANLRYSEFRVSYAIAVGNVRHLVLIGHNNCGMVNLMARKDLFIQGLITNAGWTREEAEDH